MRKLFGISFFIIAVLVIIGYLAIYTPIFWVKEEYPPNDAAQEEYWNKQNADIQEHIKMWTAQKITKYQFSISYSYNVACKRKITVENNSVVQVFEDTCPTYAYENLKTIDDLFTVIKSVANEKKCGPNGCACDGPTVMDVFYDKQYQFPKTAMSVSHREEAWRFKTSNIVSCTMLDALGITWQIDSFTPLE